MCGPSSAHSQSAVSHTRLLSLAKGDKIVKGVPMDINQQTQWSAPSDTGYVSIPYVTGPVAVNSWGEAIPSVLHPTAGLEQSSQSNGW